MAALPNLYPWLVADIGGTNVRFGLVRGGGVAVSDVLSLKCADFASPEEAALSYLQTIAQRDGAASHPATVAFALASAVQGDSVKMTNSAWTVSRSATQRALGARSVHLFNDFEALALALPRLARTDVQSIGAVELAGAGRPTCRLPMAVIGPGTGLGVAACIPAPGGGWIAVPSEGGHVTMSAADDFEADVLAAVRRDYPHVSAERLLSGIGLPVLHQAVTRVLGGALLVLDAQDITRRALAGEDDSCVRTLDTFCAMLGSFAGNVALTVGARGGVFVAGGIAQSLGAALHGSRFRQRFVAKGRFEGYLSAVSTALIVAPHAALTGAAQGIENALARTAPACTD